MDANVAPTITMKSTPRILIPSVFFSAKQSKSRKKRSAILGDFSMLLLSKNRDYASHTRAGSLKSKRRFGEIWWHGEWRGRICKLCSRWSAGGRGGKKMIKSKQMWKYWRDPCFVYVLNDNLVILICINSTRLAKDEKQMRRSTFC